jgi:hypothetical protein
MPDMVRFSIRDVLWLTVVVGLGLAWWADRSRLIDRAAYEHTILVKLRRTGWDVEAIMRQEGKDKRMFEKIPPPYLPAAKPQASRRMIPAP